MKIYRLIGVIGVAVLCVFTLLSVISHAGVVDSRHDLSYPSWGESKFQFYTVQVCVFCHTPHGANKNVREDTLYNGSGYVNTTDGASMLLWNRALSNAATEGTGYRLYSSSTMDAASNQVRAYSLLCLSCHDGVGALNVLITNPARDPNYYTEAEFMQPVDGVSDQIGDVCYPGASVPCDPDPNIGEMWPSGQTFVDLRNDHPISIDYTATHPDVGNGGLRTPDNTNGYVSGYPRIRLFPNPSNPNTLSSLECSTCHDPHNEGAKDQGTFPFLVMSNSESKLCRACHLK